MGLRTRYALPCAGLLVLSGASCASVRGHSDETANPTTQRAMAAQKQSEEALKRAQEAQKQASKQAEKAAAAQEQVRKDEVQLKQDQETLRQEQAKAQQLQEQARQESHQAAQVAQRQQTAATNALSQETQRAARGQQMAAGVVTQVRPDEVVLQPATGEAMRFRVDDQTQVQIEGQRSSADQIQEGAQARVAYEASSLGPKAVWIRADRAGATQTPATGTGGGVGTEEETPAHGASSSPPGLPQGTGSTAAPEPAQPPPAPSGAGQ